ncbi:secretin N-terminal domain-containing protein [Motilimonas pumila]|nr:secretin N-terminal domain-containing protein [Motilimonas pumila]
MDRTISTESIIQESQAELEQPKSTTTKSASVASAPLLRASQQLSNTNSLQLPAENVTLNADKMALPAFVNLALGEVLQLNYGVDPAVTKNKAKVTLRVNEPVSSARLLGLVEEVLQLNGVSLLDNEGFINVVPNNKANNRAPEFVNDTIAPKLKYGKVVEIVPVYYLPLTEASQVASRLLKPSGGTVLMQLNLNSLVVIAKKSEIDRLQDMLHRLDVPAAAGTFLASIRPAYVPVEELIPDLTQALKAAGVPITLNAGTRGVVIYPLSNNTFILSSTTEAWMNYAKAWVRQLDKPMPTQSGSDGIYTYFMKNTSAKDVYGVISKVFGQGGSSAKGDSQKKAENRSDTNTGRDSTLNISSINADYKAPERPSRDSAAIVSDDYRIVVDDIRNSLIFVGKYQDYKRVIDLLEVVDRRPRQVLLEALILSVDLSEGFNFNSNFKVSDSIADGDKVLNVGGGSLSFAGSFNNVEASLTANMSNGNTKILSSPRLIAMDQETASINVGDQVSVKTGEIGDGGDNGNITSSYKYVDTGVKLEITPSINESGVVELDINQEVSNAAAASGDDNPKIQRNAIQTKVAVESGQTIFMGGLIRTDSIESVKKVPLLGDIPGLGLLFQEVSDTLQQTEMVMMITPHILYNREDADFYTNQFKTVSGWEPVVESK